jgi:hypothetical protein
VSYPIAFEADYVERRSRLSVAGFTRFQARTLAYFSLLSDPYPPFVGSEDPPTQCA